MLVYISCICLLAGVEATHLVELAGASQYHAQDALGQYSYGYSGGPSSKIESKTLDGITRGGYSYIDANGIIQSVNYIADPVNGFRVAATNLPQAPLPEAVKTGEQLPAIKFTQQDIKPVLTFENLPILPAVRFGNPVQPIFKLDSNFAAFKFDPIPTPAKAENPTPALEKTEEKLSYVKASLPDANTVISAVPALKLSLQSSYNPLPLAFQPSPYLHLSAFPNLLHTNLPYTPYPSLPQPELPKIEAKKAELVEEIKERSKRSALYIPYLRTFLPTSSQYELKDNIGNYAYGYQNPLSAKTEARVLDGLTTGAYSYVDANGFLQSVHYTADSNGFRVAGTNLPRA